MSDDALLARLRSTLGSAYSLERELSGGGMSRVFVATETALARKVVIKVLPEEISGPTAEDRFRREIFIAARLQHAHLVPLITAGDVSGQPYFTMPYIAGESLRVRLARESALPLGDAARILREVASALAYAHANGVVHRDIKPDNVLLAGGAAMVTDFGVARALDAARGTGDGVTTAGTAVGTPAYMSPEQASADSNVDHRADLYAWGVTAYELLTGRTPFHGRTPSATLAAQVTERPEMVTRHRATIPPALATLVMRCLEKNPADRPQSAHDIVRTLDSINMNDSEGDAASLLRPGARARVLAATGIVLALLAWGAIRWRDVVLRRADARSLAVLPIDNVGGDSTREYLADGMTSELANALRKTPGLVVVGDISTFRFKRARPAPAEMTRELGVSLLLTGKLQSQGGRIRLHMQLIDGAGKLVWSETFDREHTDNFALQDDVSQAVVDKLRLALSSASVAVARAGRTGNPEAHDLYLRGVFERNKLSEQGLTRSIELFKQALALDANYAQAHAGMAMAYDWLADAYAPSHEYHVLAWEAAKKAVDADSLLAEGRVLNGFEIAAASWDFPAGLTEMRRGIALNPNAPDALFQYGIFCAAVGDDDEAFRVADRLKAVDPLAPSWSFVRAWIFYRLGRMSEALAQDSITKQLDPSFAYAEAIDGAALRELGHYEEAIAAYRAFEKLTEQPSFGLAVTYHRIGRDADANRIMRSLEQRAKTRWVDPALVMGQGYAELGDKDRAMAWLERAYRERAFFLRTTLNSDTWMLRRLKGDPRFEQLRKRVLATTFTD